MPSSFLVEPIGVLHSPFRERAAAPRQPAAARGVPGRIELFPGRGFEFALEDLASWRYVWVLFWFHQAEGWRAKIRPPRSRERRGVFATRSPHRPNPIGLSVLELVSVEGLSLEVRNVDVLDGTPVLDIKPYVAYTDAITDAGGGWLEAEAAADPGPRWRVELAPRAREQLGFLGRELGVDLGPPIMQALELGPAPHPYRRIKREGELYRLAYKQWRALFARAGDAVVVLGIGTGYRAKELYGAADPGLDVHRKFVERFGFPGERGTPDGGSEPDSG